MPVLWLTQITLCIRPDVRLMSGFGTIRNLKSEEGYSSKQTLFGRDAKERASLPPWMGLRRVCVDFAFCAAALFTKKHLHQITHALVHSHFAASATYIEHRLQIIEPNSHKQ